MDKQAFIILLNEEGTEALINFIKQQAKTSKEKPEGKSTNHEKRYLSIDELSELLSIPKNTIYAKTSRREIPYVKIGKRLLFDRKEIESWLSRAQKKALK